MVTDAQALLRAVIDRPHDDTPRSVFADLLDDLGDAARAAFIRLQVAQARENPAQPSSLMTPADRMQLCQLMGENMEAWYEQAGIPEELRPYVFFDRGFITTNFVKENLRLYGDNSHPGRNYRAPQTAAEMTFANRLQKLFDAHPGIIRQPPEPMHKTLKPVYLVVDRMGSYTFDVEGEIVTEPNPVIYSQELGIDENNVLIRAPIENVVNAIQGENDDSIRFHISRLGRVDLYKFQGVVGFFDTQVKTIHTEKHGNNLAFQGGKFDNLYTSNHKQRLYIYETNEAGNISTSQHKGFLYIFGKSKAEAVTTYQHNENFYITNGFTGAVTTSQHNGSLYTRNARTTAVTTSQHNGGLIVRYSLIYGAVTTYDHNGHLRIQQESTSKNVVLDNASGRLYVSKDSAISGLELVNDNDLPAIDISDRKAAEEQILAVVEQGAQPNLKSVQLGQLDLVLGNKELNAAREAGRTARAGVASGITSGNAAGTALPPEPPSKWVERAGEKLDPANHRNTRKNNKGKNLQERDFGPAG